MSFLLWFGGAVTSLEVVSLEGLLLLPPDLVFDQFRHEVDEEGSLLVLELPHWYFGEDVAILPFPSFPLGALDFDFGDNLIVLAGPVDLIDLADIVGGQEAVQLLSLLMARLTGFFALGRFLEPDDRTVILNSLCFRLRLREHFQVRRLVCVAFWRFWLARRYLVARLGFDNMVIVVLDYA